MNENDFEYEVFYTETEIGEAQQAQHKDIFRDLFEQKEEFHFEHNGPEGVRKTNKINIEMFAPKAEEEDAVAKKKKKGKAARNLDTDENMDEADGIRN